MREDREIVGRHLDALMAEVRDKGIGTDNVGRLLLQAVVELWMQERNIEDIASELEFAAENLDPDNEFEFMRP